MKKLFLVLAVLVGTMNVSAQNYLSMSGGGYFKPNFNEDTDYIENSEYKCPMLKVNLGHFLTQRQALELDFSMEFPKEDLNEFRLGLNYVFQQHWFFAKIGAAYKQYSFEYKYNDENINVPGVDFKVGMGADVSISKSLKLILGCDVTNMMSWHYCYSDNSLKNTAFEPYAGFKILFN